MVSVATASWARPYDFVWRGIRVAREAAVQFGQVAEKSVYGTIGHLASPRDLGVLERFVAHNLPVLKAFKKVVVATNYGPGARRELAAGNEALWRRHVPDCVLLGSEHNRGHSIGTCDLDNLLFDHCKKNDVPWLCKGANDVLLTAAVFAIEVEPSDFYYLDAISHAAMRRHGFDIAKFRAGLFYPQTNFYAINVSKTDFLVEKEFLDRSFAVVAGISGYNGRIWEHIPGWACERLLRKCVIRNRLRRCRLMGDAQFSRLLAMVKDRRLEDCSLKNLVINGICHCHDLDQPRERLL